MKCPICGYEKSQVLETRQYADGRILRRRECPECLTRWRTHETFDRVILPSPPTKKGANNHEV